MQPNKEWETIVCMICHSAEYETVYHQGRFDCQIDTVVCKKCGLVYLNPRLTKEGYDNYYREEFRSKHAVHRNIDMEYVRSLGEERGGHVELAVRNFIPQSANILEVGCGTASILYYLKQNGYSNLTGFDHSIDQYDFTDQLGFEVLKTDLDGFIAQRKGRYDLVILCHVPEHFLDPVTEMNKIRSLVNDEGYVYVEIPDLFRPYHGWSHFFQKPHAYTYCQTTLDYLWSLSGFEIASAGHRIHFLWNLIKASDTSALQIDSDLAERTIAWITRTDGDITKDTQI